MNQHHDTPEAPRFSPAYLELLREFEGFFPSPYLCPTGHVTIGYGCNLEALPIYIPWAGVRAQARHGELRGQRLLRAIQSCGGMCWTRSQAEEAMLAELVGVHTALVDRCPGYVQLRWQREFARAECLLDMGYNMGVGRAPSEGRKGSGLLGFANSLRLIERGDYAGAADNLQKSLWFRQVGRRARAVTQCMRHGRWPAVEALR